MRCIVVDDDDIQRELIAAYISEIEDLELVGSYEKATKALKKLEEEEVDLLFLDIEMPTMSGLDLLATLKYKPQVILITSHEKYAVSAFDFDVTDFLVKPAEFPRFLKAVTKARERFKESAPISKAQSGDYDMFVKDGTDLVKINTRDILFVNALSDYVKIVTPNKEYAILYTMKNLQDKLPGSMFMRVHRSYIVRLDKIEKIADHIIEIGKHLIPVSKSYRDDLYVRLNLLK